VSVFDDQQPITGVLGTVFGGLRCMQNSAENMKTNDFYIVSDPRVQVIAFTSSRCDTFYWIV
jgi:hypothetical protein